MNDIEENKTTNKSDELNSKKIDAIKELIFGENMEEYDHKFHDLFDKIEAFHDEFEERMLKTNSKIVSDVKHLAKKTDNHIESLKNELAKQIAKLDDEKSDKRTLGKMLGEISKKLLE